MASRRETFHRGSQCFIYFCPHGVRYFERYLIADPRYQKEPHKRLVMLATNVDFNFSNLRNAELVVIIIAHSASSERASVRTAAPTC